MTFFHVIPLNPPAPYLGGKKRLADKLTARLERIPHKVYAEPFFGLGGVFFRRSLVPSAEVINDASNDVYNLFRVVQKHYRELLHVLRFQTSGRANFNDFARQNPETLTDVERAARFLYLQKTCFGGKVTGRNYGVKTDVTLFNIKNVRTHVLKLHERLANVSIENLDYADFIERYDSPQTLFYLDPPYWGCENDYGASLFNKNDFIRLAGLLGNLSGRFVLSLNDTAGVRETFAAFNIDSVETMYSIAKNKNQTVKEVIISNADTH